MRKVSISICELSDDDDEGSIELGASPIDLHTPWVKDFNSYLKDQLGNMTIIEWWGVCISLIESHVTALSYYEIVVECYLV